MEEAFNWQIFLIKNQVFICGVYGIYPPGKEFNDELTNQLR